MPLEVAMRARAGSLTLVLTAAFTSLALLAPVVGPADAASGGPEYRRHDYADGQARYVLPPGENGLVNATDALAFETTQRRPPNSQDQLGQYADLLYGYPRLTNAKLGTYFNDESFGVRPQDVTRTETPGDGVTIYRDRHDVPHIYGDTDQAAAFGAGYAQAEDRLFLMDVLRHYGAGTLSSFLGASCEFEQMDHDQLLLAPYTQAQAHRQVALLPQRYGARGALAKSMIDSYVDGVNAYIAAAETDPSKMPVDYLAGAPDAAVPQPWTDADVVYIAGLIGGIFGRGGGFETDDGHLLRYLQGRYGAKAGLRAYRDLNHQNDPLAPTTITDKRFRYDVRTRSWDRSLNAIPGPRALTGGPASTSTGCGTSSGLPTGSTSGLTTRQRIGANIVQALRAMPQHMSNALVINGSHTRSGHPVAVFGPQVSYFAPQILSVLDLHAPDYDAMGASFPGTGLVELGRGRDYAWSATSAGSDLIDQRVERICDPGGGTPAANGTSYVFRGTCVPMQHETFTENVVPKAGSGGGAPATISHEIYKTRHGVVQGWTKVHGHPVAVVNQRSTYNHDIDSVIGFLGFGDPAITHDVHSWMRQANKIGYTFNWFYVDDRDTGYFVSGRDPRRNPHADPTLPTWGTGRAEWRGFLSFRQHPHEVNPKQGFFVSWNNKPAPGFAVDGEYADGQTYRSVMLVRQLHRKFRATGNSVTRADVVQAMESAASQDLDGLTVTPLLLRYLKGHHQTAQTRAMLRQLRGWLADGAHRRKARASATQYQHHAAIAINDELMPNLVRALYDRILAKGGFSGVSSTGGATVPGYTKVPMQWVNTPNSGGAHLGSAYDGGFEGYLMSTMQQLLGRHPADGFGRVLSRHECDGGPATCRKAIAHALATTYAALVTANGNRDVASWTDSTASHAAGQKMPVYDSIAFRALGLVGQPNIDWQNRPTFQQVVEFPRHRKR
ncbi:MAG TPA: penicillin acylase family protein [Nocardioides sp.]|uniref:penicillin acylase family protein n=1 Tax=Nocardioides sp. TaxID=35761 RepID=UPI002F40F38D